MTPAEFDALTRTHSPIFVRRVFAELNPGVTYYDNWHLRIIMAELEQMRVGDLRRLAVALPPRSLKSIIISVAYVAWLLGHNPATKVIAVSYGQELADKMAFACRQVIQSAWYRRLFPATRLAHGRQGLSAWETSAGGGRFSTSVGGVLTGFGADYIIVDDPMKPDEALSDAERAKINDWVKHSLFTRLDDKRNGRIVVVHQRLHEDDVIGHIMGGNDE
jgi:hypothetical protein